MDSDHKDTQEAAELIGEILDRAQEVETNDFEESLKILHEGTETTLTMLSKIVQEALAPFAPDNCSCPVCSEALKLLADLRDSVASSMKLLPEKPEDPGNVYFLIGMVAGMANTIPHQIHQANCLADGAHEAYGIIIQNRIQLKKDPENAEPDAYLLNFDKPTNPNKIN